MSNLSNGKRRTEILLKQLIKIDKSKSLLISFISQKKGRGINYTLRVGLHIYKGKVLGVPRTAGSRNAAEEIQHVRHGLTIPNIVQIQGFGLFLVSSFALAL